AAIVGGIGIAPGANINYSTGVSIFEATHGTAPKYKDQDKVNPSSEILSGVMMLEYMGWGEAADLIVKGLNGAIGKKTVTYDFELLMEVPYYLNVLNLEKRLSIICKAIIMNEIGRASRR